MMAFICIQVPKECGRLLSNIKVPGKKESASEYHITLLFFENNYPIDKVCETLKSAFEALSDIKPFSVKTDTVSSFPVKNGDPYPVIALIKSDELHELNEKLKKQFDKDSIEYSKVHKTYRPHITLAYSEKKMEEFKIDAVKFVVQEVVMWCGDTADNRLFVTFPLQGPERKKKAEFLAQEAEMFWRLAEGGGMVLGRTEERRKSERN